MLGAATWKRPAAPGVCDGRFGAGHSSSSLTALASRSAIGTKFGSPGSDSHAGLGTLATSDAGARLMRRHSWDQKKKRLLRQGSTGPPSVPPKLLYRSSGRLAATIGSVL